MYSQERFAGEIRTVPMASFPTFSVTENKPLLFLQQSLAYYLAIQWIKKHTRISVEIPVWDLQALEQQSLHTFLSLWGTDSHTD